MSDWRESIIKPFETGISRKTVVADPDELFRDDKIFCEISSRGFTLIYFEDTISFRFTYESEFREAWDRGENHELVVVVRPDTLEVEKLPADVLQDARRLEFYLKDVFPYLSYSVVSKLDRSYFDVLYRAHSQYAKQSLGEEYTRDFILKHVFETVPELIRKDSDLLRILLQRHYRKQQVPAPLDEYFVSVLNRMGRFKDWPLKAIVPDRGAFWDFLQERWPLFVERQAGGAKEGRQVAEFQALKYPGILDLPFDHDDVRVYIFNLFNEGILKPINWLDSAIKTMPWIRIGLKGGTEAQVAIRFEEICNAVEANAPAIDASVHDWLTFAYQYGQMQRFWSEKFYTLKTTHKERHENLLRRLNTSFAAWASSIYLGIYNYPAVTPVMVHHIPAFLANRLAQKEASKVAFLLIDALSMDQWLVLKDYLSITLAEATLRENALMAWVPTITSVSRQAAFSGKIPVYFAETIYRTDRDEYGWRQFWSDRGLQLDQVGFIGMRGDRPDLDRLDTVMDRRVRALGCVIFKVDEIAHGVQVGAPGMISQVKTWAADGFLCALVGRLLKEEYHVCISADHGNVAALGIGAPKEGVLSETKGERCRVYSDPRLRASMQSAFPGSVAWDHLGLPRSFNCLLAPEGKAFAQEGQTVICHGGNSLDEVIVPFIEISHKKVGY